MIDTCNGNMQKKNKKIWSYYNESLVNRTVILLDFSMLEKWETLIEKENKDKFGRPYEYTVEFFEFLMRIRALWNHPFRNLESFVRVLSKITGKFRPLTNVAIFKRIRSLSTDGIVREINGNIEGS
ncbi:MAG: transposase [Thermoplasmata archaeon]